jgi:hypothetical protein
MPRRYRKNKRGGFLGLENLFGTSSEEKEDSDISGQYGNSEMSGMSSNSMSGQYGNSEMSGMSSNSMSGQYGNSMSGQYQGGKKSKRGGSLASYASPISGIRTAQPHHILGGPHKGGRRTKKRRGGKHRHTKSCKHKKH